MDRNYWARHIAGLDPETEYEQIYRIMTTHEFPWDMNQSLSFALYRTYAALSELEKTASANYYRVLGRLMGIKDLPATHQEFASSPTSAATRMAIRSPTWGPSPHPPAER
jgi:hypothetical protein